MRQTEKFIQEQKNVSMPKQRLRYDTPLAEVVKYAQKSCGMCGTCCTGNSFALEKEIDNILKGLNIKRDDISYFFNEGEVLGQKVYSFKKINTGKKKDACIFATSGDDYKTDCQIHEFKPSRCSTFVCKDTATSAWFYFNMLKDLNPSNLRELLSIMEADRRPNNVSPLHIPKKQYQALITIGDALDIPAKDYFVALNK